MYNSNNIAERIKLVARSKGIAIKKMLEDVGLGSNTMANMRTSMPKADNLAKIADYLGCSVDFLLGRENEKSLTLEEESKAVEMISLFNNIPESTQKEAMNYLRYLAEHKQEE